MIDINKKDIVMISAFFSLLVVSLFVIQILIVPLIFSLILVYLLNPIYSRLKKIFKFHFVTSLSVVFLFFLVTVFPIFLVSAEMSKEVYLFETDALDSSLISLQQGIFSFTGIEVDLNSRYDLIMEKTRLYVENLVFKLPEFLFNLFLITFFFYYFSKDFNRQRQYLRSVFKNGFKVFEEKLNKLLFGIVYGQIFVRFVQALIGTIGFVILGVQGAIFWGPMLFFVAFLPILGTGLIWFPLAIFNFMSGNIFLGLSILVLGLIISLLDNFLLPHVVSGKTNMGPVVTLISIIGGISIFGLYGIILGPLFLGLLIMITTDLFDEIRRKSPDIGNIFGMKKREMLISL
jgi:predicted PurR-regulated permease PerM